MFRDEDSIGSTAGADPRGESEDRALLAAAARIARDFAEPDPLIYWGDMIVTAGVAYGSFIACIVLPLSPWSVGCAVLAAFAFYRGLSFIHELSHVRAGRLRGFRTGWNILFGVPLLTLSFLYDDVHLVHHSRLAYGTRADPEYLRIGAMQMWQVALFLLVAALAPLGLLLRFLVLAPAGMLSPALRRRTVTQWSSLAINHKFRRKAPSGSAAREWRLLEFATSCWTIVLSVLVISDEISVRSFLTGLLVGGGVALLNQWRTLVSHIWGNEGGEVVSLTRQFQDSVNFTCGSFLISMIAPVGLRYHALHHLVPSVPYHHLKRAHARLSEELGFGSAYRSASYSKIRYVIQQIFIDRAANSSVVNPRRGDGLDFKSWQTPAASREVME